MKRLFAILFLLISGCCAVASPIQITGGAGGAFLGLCAVNCTSAPNPVLPTEFGIYMSGNATAAAELVVLLVPNDTTNLFATNPFDTVTIYDTNPLAATGATGSSAFATASNAVAFGLSGANYQGGGFYGTLSDASAQKVGDYLNIGLSNSINMQGVSAASNGLTNAGAHQFGVYAILVNASVGAGQLLDIGSSALPEGTFLSVITDTGLANPIGTAGVTDTPPGPQAPEPASFVLLGIGLIGLGAWRRRGTR